MIDEFIEYFVGTFENRKQAFSRPAFFSPVHLIHKPIGNNWFYGEQQNFWHEKPYRQFVVEIIEKDNKIISRNYKIDNDKHYHLRNMDKIFDSLVYKEKCDTVFEYTTGKFIGKIEGCNCIVEWDGEKTYVENSAILMDGSYEVYDRGISIESKKRIWGSAYGHYNFIRIDKEPLLMSP